MWLKVINLLFGISAYFWDVWIDVVVGKEQWAMTFPEYKFPGKGQQAPTVVEII